MIAFFTLECSHDADKKKGPTAVGPFPFYGCQINLTGLLVPFFLFGEFRKFHALVAGFGSVHFKAYPPLLHFPWVGSWAARATGQCIEHNTGKKNYEGCKA